jgi:hypothetical protein
MQSCINNITIKKINKMTNFVKVSIFALALGVFASCGESTETPAAEAAATTEAAATVVDSAAATVVDSAAATTAKAAEAVKGAAADVKAADSTKK